MFSAKEKYEPSKSEANQQREVESSQPKCLIPCCLNYQRVRTATPDHTVRTSIEPLIKYLVDTIK